MTVRQLRILALLPCLSGPVAAEAAAEPPLWANLAACSAVFSAVSGADGYAGAAEGDLARTDALAAAFLDRAVRGAGAAGQADPAADVAAIMDYLVPRWENRIANLASLRSNLDWIGYCGRLGRAEGLLPLQPAD